MTICPLPAAATAAAGGIGDLILNFFFFSASHFYFLFCVRRLFPAETTVEETYDRMFTVTSRVRFSVTKEDDGVPVDCIVDHPAVKDLLAQRHLEVLCK